MKYLIAGLGNIGAEYVHTRHNIGFDVIDQLAEQEELSFKLDRHAEVAEYKHKGRTFVLIKPTTYMNLSGKAVRYWMTEHKIPLDRLLVITDDIALPVGKLRLRKKGSDGGHNGLKSIQELLGTVAYPRLRFGVGSNFHPGQQVDHVLGKWSADEEKVVQEKINLSVDLIKAFGTNPIARVMNDYNNR